MNTKASQKMCLIIVLGFINSIARNANADFVFGTPNNLGTTVNSSGWDILPTISTDGLSLFIISDRPGGYGNLDIWVTTRATTDDPWGTPVNLGATINSPVAEWGVSISSDGLSLYFSRGGVGNIWLTTRATTDDDWGNPVNLGPTVNSSADDFAPNISADDLSLYFSSNRPGGVGGYDLWVTTRPTIDDPWGTPVNLVSTVNSSANDVAPGISADGLSLFFTSNRSGGSGGLDLWVTTRATTDDPWGEPVNFGSTVNSSTWDAHPAISADGSTIFFMSERPGGLGSYDLWQVSIIPIVDFNGDGIVDSADMCIIVDHWGTDEPLCDIGPMPWGDGIVDVQDLIVLTEYLAKEKVDVEADIAAINELYDLYCLGANTGDLDLFISLWDDNAIKMNPDVPAVFGKEQIRALFQTIFGLFNNNVVIYGETEVQVAGDWAFSRGSATLTTTPKEGGPTTYMDCKWLDTLKRQADGSWKIYRDCFNYNAPPTVE